MSNHIPNFGAAMSGLALLISRVIVCLLCRKEATLLLSIAASYRASPQLISTIAFIDEFGDELAYHLAAIPAHAMISFHRCVQLARIAHGNCLLTLGSFRETLDAMAIGQLQGPAITLAQSVINAFFSTILHAIETAVASYHVISGCTALVVHAFTASSSLGYLVLSLKYFFAVYFIFNVVWRITTSIWYIVTYIASYPRWLLG